MHNQITTAHLTDLLQIFDPAVQQLADGARILYTFDDDGSFVRQRVGERFKVSVSDIGLNFVVIAPLDSFIYSGEIFPDFYAPGVEEVYPLSSEGLTSLINDVSIALGFGSDDTVLSLLESYS